MRLKIRLKNILLLTLLVCSVFSCVKDTKESAATLYIKAHESLKSKDYLTAAEQFEKVADEYPFSKWGIEGQVMAIYAYYKEGNNIKMISNIDNFINLNPSSSYIDYILYMKGIVYYEQIPSINRAQNISQSSLDIFNNLITRFPESKYSADAKSKLNFIIEHISGSYMAKGRFQGKQNNYIGAINNFLKVINDYDSSNQVPEAYYRIAEIYHNLGLTSLTNRALLELKTNYQQSSWNKLAQNKFD
jgi:outer membrane protein assembly factor BamD